MRVILARATIGLLKDMDRDNFMSAEAAVKYGLADKVVNTRKAIKGDETKAGEKR